MRKNLKKGFSLVEMMLLLLIVSLVTAGSMSVITKKHARIPKKIVHGKYICGYNEAGQLYQERFIENKSLGAEVIPDGGSCVFEPPKKATYFYIQLVGGGGGGGDAGSYDGEHTPASESIGFGPRYISRSYVNGLGITTEEFRGITADYTVQAAAYGGDGGKGASCTCGYPLSTGDCVVPDTKSQCPIGVAIGVTSCTEAQVAAGCTFDKYSRQTDPVEGAEGGQGGQCITSAIPLDFDLSGDYNSGSNGYSYTSSSYWNTGHAGDNGYTGSAYIGSASCSAGRGTGGSAATCNCAGITSNVIPPTTKTPGTSAHRDSGYNGSGFYINGERGRELQFTHDYETGFGVGGDGGYAGEYLAVFVRSFKSNTLQMKPGKAGSAGTWRSGANGETGGETTVADGALAAAGGMGGQGSITLPTETLPPLGLDANEIQTWLNGLEGNYSKSFMTDNYIGQRAAYADAANMAGMNDIPKSENGIDLNIFGKGGNGSTSVNGCWIGNHIRKFEGHELLSTFRNYVCSANGTTTPAEDGKPGAVVIVW